jgi:hypothetical protein
METTSNKPRAVAGCDREDSPRVLSRAKIMYVAILAAIAQFPNLPITMAAFLALIEPFDAAQGSMKAKPRGLASVRDTKRDDVWTAMHTLRIYVQSLADGLSAPAATALIELAGLLVAGVPIHVKPFLEAKPTTLPGVVHILANASLLLGSSSKRATFNWQWSTDGGKKDGRACGLRAHGSAGRGVAPAIAAPSRTRSSSPLLPARRTPARGPLADSRPIAAPSWAHGAMTVGAVSVSTKAH